VHNHKFCFFVNIFASIPNFGTLSVYFLVSWFISYYMGFHFFIKTNQVSSKSKKKQSSNSCVRVFVQVDGLLHAFLSLPRSTSPLFIHILQILTLLFRVFEFVLGNDEWMPLVHPSAEPE